MTNMVKRGTTFEAEHVFETGASQAFALSVGDTNPAHHDPKSPAAARFGGMIASGTETTARMMGLTAGYFSGLGPTLGLEFTFRFRRAVPMGARTLIRWTVTDIEHKPGLGHIATSTGTLTLVESGEVAVEATSKGVLLDQS